MRRVILAAGMVALLGGCAAGAPGLRPLTYQEPGETRLYVSYSACPDQGGDQLLGVLGPAIALSAASKLLDSFGTALAKGAEGGQLPASVAMANAEFDEEAAALPRCLIVIRGRFQKRDAEEVDDTLSDNSTRYSVLLVPTRPVGAAPPTGNGEAERPASSSTKVASLPKVYQLQHYLELALVGSSNKSALTFAPVYLKLGKSMDGDTSGMRNVSIAVKLSAPGGSEVGSAVTLGDLAIGSPVTYVPYGSGNDEKIRIVHFPIEAPWFAMPFSKAKKDNATTQVAPSAGTTNRAAGAGGGGNPAGGGNRSENGGGGGGGGHSLDPAQGGTPASDKPDTTKPAPQADQAETPKSPYPFTISVTVVETRPTKEALAFLASVFTAVRPAIDSTLKGAIDPATIKSDKSKDLGLLSAYSKAEGAARAAIYTYCTADTSSDKTSLRLDLSGKAQSAQIDLNKAANDLGWEFTYSGDALVRISGGDPKTVNRTACSAAAL